MKLTIERNTITHIALAMMAVYAAALLPMDALAVGTSLGASDDEGNKISDVLCSAINLVQGPIGSGLATLAIIVIGMGALMGKVSWGMAIIVGIGIGIIFGAPTIVDQISQGSGGNGC